MRTSSFTQAREASYTFFIPRSSPQIAKLAISTGPSIKSEGMSGRSNCWDRSTRFEPLENLLPISGLEQGQLRKVLLQGLPKSILAKYGNPGRLYTKIGPEQITC